MRLAVVGAGRVGTTVAVAAHEAGHRVVGVWSRTGERAAALAARVGARVGEPRELVRVVDILLLAVPDRAVGELARQLEGQVRGGRVLAHLSGALPADALSPARGAGGLLLSWHPVQTLPVAYAPPAVLRGAGCALEGDEAAVVLGESLARSLGMKPFRVPAEGKALYHAGAMVAAGGLVGVMGLACRLWRAAGVEDPVRWLRPLAERALANVETWGPRGALTGPVVRGDEEVLRAHRRAIGERLPQEAELYEALLQGMRRLAAEEFPRQAGGGGGTEPCG